MRSEDVDAILDAVRPLGFKFAAIPMTFDAGTPRERKVQRVSRVDGEMLLTLDLLLAGALFADVLAGRQQLSTSTERLWAVSLEGLAKMKRLAGRPQDLADLERLGLG